MPRAKNEVLTIRTTAEVKALLKLAAERGASLRSVDGLRCWSLTTRDRMVSPFQIQIGLVSRLQQRQMSDEQQ